MVCGPVAFHSEEIFAGLRRIDNAEVYSKAFNAHLWVNVETRPLGILRATASSNGLSNPSPRNVPAPSFPVSAKSNSARSIRVPRASLSAGMSAPDDRGKYDALFAGARSKHIHARSPPSWDTGPKVEERLGLIWRYTVADGDENNVTLITLDGFKEFFQRTGALLLE